MATSIQPALQTHPSFVPLTSIKVHTGYQVFPCSCSFFLKELPSALKSALSGHLETVILGLLKTPAQYDASELKASMKVNTCEMQSLSNLPLIFVNYSFLGVIRWFSVLLNSHLEPSFFESTEAKSLRICTKNISITFFFLRP